MKHDRSYPPSVTIIVSLVLSFTFWNLIRVISALKYWSVLNEFGSNPIYIFLSGICWLLAGTLLLFLILKQHPISSLFGFIFSSGYFSWYWIDRLFTLPSPAPNVFFIAIISTSVYIFFIIMLKIKNTKQFISMPS